MTSVIVSLADWYSTQVESMPCLNTSRAVLQYDASPNGLHIF